MVPKLRVLVHDGGWGVTAESPGTSKFWKASSSNKTTCENSPHTLLKWLRTMENERVVFLSPSLSLEVPRMGYQKY